jgi:hypothetical protein
VIYDLDPIEAQIIERYREEQALCVCGHQNNDHDGGLGGQYCDGSGTHNTVWANLNPEKLCRCRRFRKAE